MPSKYEAGKVTYTYPDIAEAVCDVVCKSFSISEFITRCSGLPKTDEKDGDVVCDSYFGKDDETLGGSYYLSVVSSKGIACFVDKYELFLGRRQTEGKAIEVSPLRVLAAGGIYISDSPNEASASKR